MDDGSPIAPFALGGNITTVPHIRALRIHGDGQLDRSNERRKNGVNFTPGAKTGKTDY